jgi:hypothetical protein
VDPDATPADPGTLAAALAALLLDLAGAEESQEEQDGGVQEAPGGGE